MDNLILIKNHQASSMLEQSNEELFETIKIFVEYARTQDFCNADKYPDRITEAINRALFTYDGKRPSNIINLLNSKQQKHVLVAEDIFIYNLEAGMAKNLDHRDIYFHACFEVIGFAGIIGKSIVPSKDITESIKQPFLTLQTFQYHDGNTVKAGQDINGQIWLSIEDFCKCLGIPGKHEELFSYLEPSNRLEVPVMADSSKADLYMTSEASIAILDLRISIPDSPEEGGIWN